MNALLVMNQGREEPFGILVYLNDPLLKAQVNALVHQEKNDEAFNILKKNAQVQGYVPFGEQPSLKPDVTVFEESVKLTPIA